MKTFFKCLEKGKSGDVQKKVADVWEKEVFDLFHRSHLSLSKSCYTLSSSFQYHGTDLGMTYLFMQNQESVLFLVFLYQNNYNSLKDLPILSKFEKEKNT